MSAWELEALWLSAQVAVLTLLLSTPLALVLASVMARARWRGHWLLDVVVLLPMALPPAVVGFALLMGLSHEGPMGQWLGQATGWTLDFFPSGAVLAATLVTTPLMVRVLRPALEAIDPLMVPVAHTLGASSWNAWWTITLPLATPAVLSAMTLGLAAAWGETGATLVLASALQPNPRIDHATPTVPLALMQALRSPDNLDAAMRLALISVGVAFVAVVLSEAGRRHWQGQWAALRRAGARP